MGSRQQGYVTLKDLAGNNLLSKLEDYRDGRSLLLFRCKECDQEYNTTGWLYKKSEDSKRCLKCKKKKKCASSEEREEYLRECIEVHGQYYDYSLVPDTFKMKDRIKIICPEHGVIEINAFEHKKCIGCGSCKGNRISQTKRKSVEQFIFEAHQKHNCKYGYDLVEYVNAQTKVKILCPKHGLFEQTPDVHLRGSGCSRCTNTSKSVRLILGLLEKHNVAYETEKIFKDCRDDRPLPFDVYIPEYNLCVEYDGIHHFKPTQFGSQTYEDALVAFENTKKHDTFKDIYCEERNLDLIRIAHTTNNPDAYLLNFLQNREKRKYFYSIDQYEEDMQKIFNYIRSFNYEEFCVYGILRGGLIMATHISNVFDCPLGVAKYQRYDSDDSRVILQVLHRQKDLPIFLVDDLISSGITIARVRSFLLHKFKKATIHPIVLFGEPNNDNIFYIQEHPRQWIVFFWEGSF